MNCWHQSYILSLWTEEKGGSAGRGLYHERSKEGRDVYIAGSELQANMKRMDTSFQPWNERQFRISFVYEQGSYK
ncbi:hypothetical protein KSP40_PGU004928 [Platanthera guangdongensis]|uniref:Uncharacterized protein n=1 Tax=Platanthera guangdongensis TaxID=2320717 RepID=A0ABR2MY16_9ASPA